MSDTKPNSIAAPLGWGNDKLTEFLETAYQNRFATFANKPDQYLRLSQIDKCFVRIGDGWMNPPNLVPPLLFFRSHAAFRAACEHAMAGQIIDTFVSIRGLIETAGYALHIHRILTLKRCGLEDMMTKLVKRRSKRNLRFRKSVSLSAHRIEKA